MSIKINGQEVKIHIDSKLTWKLREMKYQRHVVYYAKQDIIFQLRLLAVPFSIVERAREIAESACDQQRCEIRARSLQVSAFSHGYFARPLDYPERDC